MTLVGWWPLHDATGAAVDYSPSNAHGTVYGATPGATGPGPFTAYSLDGSNDYIDMGVRGSLNATFPMTVAGWVYVDSAGGDQRLFSRWPGGSPGFLLQVEDTTDEWRFLVADNSGNRYVDAATGLTQTGQWQHVAGVAEPNGSLRLYLDGELAGTNDSTATISGRTGEALVIGCYRDNDNRKNLGADVCDLRFYDHDLSASAVRTLIEWGTDRDLRADMVIAR